MNYIVLDLYNYMHIIIILDLYKVWCLLRSKLKYHIIAAKTALIILI